MLGCIRRGLCRFQGSGSKTVTGGEIIVRIVGDFRSSDYSSYFGLFQNARGSAFRGRGFQRFWASSFGIFAKASNNQWVLTGIPRP